MQNAQPLLQQIIVITGASRGMGRALALHMAQQGATIILLGRSIKKLESVYDEIVACGAPEPAIHPLDLLKMTPDDARLLAENIEKMFGRCDALIHNAGISGPITPLEHLPPHRWQEVIHLNLNAPYLLTHALLPLLGKSSAASVVFTTANEGVTGKAYWSAYSASKFGIIGLAQSLHEELENTTIRVRCINPGTIRTALRVNAYPGRDPDEFPLPERLCEHYTALLLNTAPHFSVKNIPKIEKITIS